MKNILLILLMLTFTTSQAQKDHLITLEAKDSLQTNFYIKKVIDARSQKENIGVAQKGAFNKKVPANFSEDFVPHLQNYFNNLLPANEEKIPLILKVDKLYISERTSAMSEQGVCEVQLEFLKDVDGQEYSLGIFSSSLEGKGMDVTGKHDERIKDALKNCITEFSVSNWKEMELQPLSTTNITETFNWDTKPVKGLYMNFDDLKNNKPHTDVLFNSKLVGKNKKAEHYMAYQDGKKKRIKKLFGYSDGEDIFLSASNYTTTEYFVKALLKGRYIYFEDQFSSPTAAATFGVVGAMASMKHTGIILDSKTGITSILNNKNMEKLLRKYPELLIEYDKTDKSVEADRLMIQKINELEQYQS
ncbi:hypothetical protein [Autumnicola musiva]|uniref:Tail specific protease domain-containing protein n=1 Tax=Autumnicola musiva TaxID=3075589 RepID=A0ABU3D1C3_9FLAO|nr:hypothetical protein [Zunongwangia sp. F117]MDT0675199.1 hypothetical protein [Zunongwangia sp. F117]